MLAERAATVCAVVYDSNISINDGPLNASLKGANLGTVALRVLSAPPALRPLVRIAAAAARRGARRRRGVRGGAELLLRPRPRPVLSVPYDTGRQANG